MVNIKGEGESKGERGRGKEKGDYRERRGERKREKGQNWS